MEKTEIERPWCVCRLADGRLVQVGKIKSFVKGSPPGFARVLRQEEERYPSIWNAAYLERFATAQEAVQSFARGSNIFPGSGGSALAAKRFLRRFPSEAINFAK